MADQVFFSSDAELEGALRELAARVLFPATAGCGAWGAAASGYGAARQAAVEVRAGAGLAARGRRGGGDGAGTGRGGAGGLARCAPGGGRSARVARREHRARARGAHARAWRVTRAAASRGLRPVRRSVWARPATLDAARAQVGFAVLLPGAIGEPDAVYVRNGDQVSLVYAPRDGLPPAPAQQVWACS